MKRLLLAASAVFSLSACGMFTNVPAQIHIASVKPATVSYGKLDADGIRDVKIEPAQVTLVGEPGSIGVNFAEMKIQYLSPSLGLISNNEILALSLRANIRVESSNFPTDPAAGAITQSEVGTKVQIGKTTFDLPVVTRHVSAYGLRSDVNAAAITAQVTLSGFDDAGFPASTIVYVPIAFIGTPNK